MHVYYTMQALISVSLPDLYTKDATVLYLSRVLNLRAGGGGGGGSCRHVWR